MTGMFKKAMKPGENIIGKNNKEFTPDIMISGVGISGRHCVIVYDDASRVSQIQPNSEDPNKYQIKVNGEPVVAEARNLVHGDRVLIGTHHYYLFTDPQIDPEETFEWEQAMKEANADSMKMLDTDDGELAKIRA